MLKLHPRANGGPEAWFPPSHGQVLKMATRHLTPSVSNPTRKKRWNTPKNNLKTSCNHALWEARWLTGLAVLDTVCNYISLFVLGLWFSLPSSSRLFLERQFRPLFSWMHSDSTAWEGHRQYAFSLSQPLVNLYNYNDTKIQVAIRSIRIHTKNNKLVYRKHHFKRAAVMVIRSGQLLILMSH